MEKRGRHQKSILVLITVAVVALGIFGMVSLAREIQEDQAVQSHVAAAERYLAELDYGKAIVEYVLALEIEPNRQSVLDSLENTYQEYARYSLSAGEWEKAAEILQEAAARFENQELQELMAEAEKQTKAAELLTAAENCQAEGRYEDSLAAYDELLELDVQKESVLDGLEECLRKYIDKLMSEKDFDSVRGIIERYRSVPVGDKLEELFLAAEEQLELAGLLASAQEYWADQEYDKSLETYDRLLELDGQNPQGLEELGKCLEEYINFLLQEKKYQQVKDLVNQYQKTLPNMDFQSILSRIEAEEKRVAEELAFMQKIYDLMGAGDWNAMCELDGSEETEAFLAGMETDSHVYLVPKEDGGKVGAGVYRYGAGSHYFYYGEYGSDAREGNGTSFARTGEDGYELFIGEWKEDAPNGQGEIQYVGEDPFVEKGNFINGLFEGEINIQVTLGKETYEMSFEASQGRPLEDKTEDVYQKCASSDLVAENEYICAYSEKGGKVVYGTAEETTAFGAAGFGTSSGSMPFGAADLPKKEVKQPQSALSKAEKILNGAALFPVGSGSEALDALIQEIFSQILTAEMSTYEKVKACYDWLIVNTAYGSSFFFQAWEEVGYMDFTIAGAYEVLKYHEGVCEDYSAAFLFMTRAIGLDSYLEQGMTHKAGGGYTGHVWTVVVIDGEIYVFDPQVEDNIAKGGAIQYYRFCKTYAEVPDKYIVE